ncbi:flavin reductase, partial [Pseudomonas sp. RTC3]|nr:flavin reductase [Pseudomonas sp. RTC3]
IPPIFGCCSVGPKDILNNSEQTGEFGCNLATRPLAEAMNKSCAAVPPGTDEFELANLTPVASRIIKEPRVLDTPVSFECKVTQIV